MPIIGKFDGLDLLDQISDEMFAAQEGIGSHQKLK